MSRHLSAGSVGPPKRNKTLQIRMFYCTYYSRQNAKTFSILSLEIDQQIKAVLRVIIICY